MKGKKQYNIIHVTLFDYIWLRINGSSEGWRMAQARASETSINKSGQQIMSVCLKSPPVPEALKYQLSTLKQQHGNEHNQNKINGDEQEKVSA